MEKKSCVFEKELLNSLRKGNLNLMAKQHLENCTLCRESMIIQRWMNNFQVEGVEKSAVKKLPDAEYLWEKAYAPVVPGKMLEKKALIPLLFSQVLAYVTAIVVTVYLFITNFSRIKDLLANKLEFPTIITSFLTIIKVFFKSNAYISIPVTLGFAAVIIFTLLEALEGKNFRTKNRYIF